MDYLIEHVRQGILLGLLLSMPPILAAAAVGLVVGILQAVTQVQEQTISAVPKMIIVFAIIILFGSTMLEMSGGYIRESFVLAFQRVPATGVFLMPALEKHEGYNDGSKDRVYVLQENEEARRRAQPAKRGP